jgi:hypothetical protein
MQTLTQFSIFLVNKPGVLAQVCQRLAADKLNILAMSMMDSMEHGVLRVVVENTNGARQAIKDLGVPATETDVMVADLPNRPGALADVVERLSKAHVNVSYAYCTTGARNGKTNGIFKVSDLKKAVKVLSERKPQRKSPKKKIRDNVRVRTR